MIVKPFRGLRPRADLSSRIPSCPYDVVSSGEARRLAGDDPYSFLHVIRPEIDLDPGIGPHDPRVYAKGRENLRAMIDNGWLVQDTRASYYVYRLSRPGHSQVGIVGAAAVQDYLDDRIKKHEHTRPDKEQDRVALNDALSATPGPIFLIYRDLAGLTAMARRVADGEPRARLTASDEIEHALWAIDDPESCAEVEKRFRAVPETYVADGHHRTAAAARVCARRLEREGCPPADAPCRFFMAVHFPADQVRILDYNRVVADLNGLTAPEFIERVRRAGFDVTDDHKDRRPPGRGTIGVYVDGEWFLLAAKPQIIPEGDVVRRLDISILSDHLLGPILGIGDPRIDQRIDFVGGSRGMEELERRVDSGEQAVAFALFPTSIDDVMAAADAGKVMPPKSTWFEPKLRSGLVVQLLDGERL